MAAHWRVSSFQDIAITRFKSLENPMHPLATYLAITDSQRTNGWGSADERRTPFARVDALPIDKPEPVASGSRIGRVAEMVRRLVVRTAGA